jgi:hypothetical protein
MVEDRPNFLGSFHHFIHHRLHQQQRILHRRNRLARLLDRSTGRRTWQSTVVLLSTGSNPIYEFLPALGFILAIIIGLRRKAARQNPTSVVDEEHDAIVLICSTESLRKKSSVCFKKKNKHRGNELPQHCLVCFVWWSVTSVVAFSYAGERMPWLTLHITLAYDPHHRLGNWAYHRHNQIGRNLKERRILLTVATLLLSLSPASAGMVSCTQWKCNPPFQGQELEQLQATSAFLLAFHGYHPKRSRPGLSPPRVDFPRWLAHLHPCILWVPGHPHSTSFVPRFLYHLRPGNRISRLCTWCQRN